MIILILIILAMLFIFIEKIAYKYSRTRDYCFIEALCEISLLFLIVALVFILIITIGVNISAEGQYQANKQMYEALLYKLDSVSVRDKFGLLNKEYVDEIQQWNINYSKHKAYSENIWIGIMFPKKNIQGMDVIELNRFK